MKNKELCFFYPLTLSLSLGERELIAGQLIADSVFITPERKNRGVAISYRQRGKKTPPGRNSNSK